MGLGKGKRELPLRAKEALRIAAEDYVKVALEKAFATEFPDIVYAVRKGSPPKHWDVLGQRIIGAYYVVVATHGGPVVAYYREA